MNARERLTATLQHRQPDRVVCDLGATSQSGIGAGVYYRLREALGLPRHPVKIIEPAQLLAEVEEDVLSALGVDVVGLWNPVNTIGTPNRDWKPWTMPDGTPVLIPGEMHVRRVSDGYYYTYPGGDTSVAPSMKMPPGGYFFDNIDRGGDFDEDNLDARGDFAGDFSLFTEETCRYLERESIRLFEETDYGIVGMCGGGGFGDVFTLPACWRREIPRGIRRMEDWLMAHILYPDYIRDLFAYQLEYALKNLELYRQAVGERIQVIWVGGTDFGTQNGLFTSVENYRRLYKPYQKKLNDWVHAHTNWKTMFHTCGAVAELLDDFAEAGIDILNPVQCSAAGMDPVMLKREYGDKFVFWGAGMDTQQVLPFGTPQQVEQQVTQRLEIFSPGGGYVFNAIHNIIGGTPAENVLAAFHALREFNRADR